MPSNYPAGFDSLNNPVSTDPLDSVSVPHADQHADINDAVEALQQVIGLNPQGSAANLTTRVTDNENDIATLQSDLLGLDASVEAARQDAEQSAAEASGFAVDAGTARDAAVTAQGDAETARDGAVAAQTAAQGSANDAASDAQDADSSKTNALASETNAASSALLAEQWASKTDGPVIGGAATDYSAKYWAQVANPANGITQTIFDAKGDLLVAAGDDMPARLGVGTNGQALVADSTEPTGVKWGDVVVDAYTKAESDANYDPAGSAASAQSAAQTYTDNALLAFQPTGDSFTAFEFVATASQTVFSGADANGLTLAIAPGNQQVYLNGVLLRSGDDYTVTATSLTLLSAAAVGDDVQVIAYATFTVADAYTKAESDGKYATVTSLSGLASDFIVHDTATGDVHGVASTDSIVGGNGVDRILKLTQAEYDALGTPEGTTLYVIVG